MFLFFLFVASQIGSSSACSCATKIFQETYCKSNYVIRARKLRDGTISGQPKPTVDQWNKVFEVNVRQVYKQPEGDGGIERNDVIYMVTSDMSKSATCGMQLNDGRDYLFIFQDKEFALVNSCTSRMWKRVSGFQEKLLSTAKYDCDCELDNCVDRTTNVVGKERECISSPNHADLLFCAKSSDERQRCVWKGPKKSCVNPAGQYGKGNYAEYGKHKTGKRRKLKRN